MMENGFVSPRGDRFPAGLRVLVVDDDPTWLKILEKMLRKCSFEPTICGRATTALDILRERKDGFDIVISDVNMPDMDGFNLLEQVGLEMNLPVIMMSVDGETSRVMKGVQHGACDYLLKPIRMKELQNIWQHVLRKKINGVVNIESHEGNENIQKMENMLYEFDGSHLLTGADSSSEKKRKELENHGLDDYDFFDPSSAKKTRLVWSIELHQKFVSAVNRIGLDKAGPKKILDLMNVPWLTRENVASHLQKYRLYLSRLQNQDDPNSSSDAINKPHFSYKDPPESFGQKPTALNQKTESGCTFGYSGSKRPFQDLSPEVHENVAEDTRMCAVNLLGSGTDVNHTPFQSSVPQQHSWSGEIQMMHFTQRPTEEQKLRKYTNLHLPSPDYHIQMEYLNPVSSDNPRTCITATDKTGGGFEVKPLFAEHRDNHSVKTETKSINSDVFCAMPTSISFTDINSHDFDQYYASNLEYQRQSYGPETLASSQGDLQPFSLQASVENVALNNLEFFCPEQGTELSTHFYDGVNLISGYQCEPIDYSTINESLFIL